MLAHVSVTIFVWVGEEKVMMPIAPNEYFLDALMSRMVVSHEPFFRNIQRYGERIEKLFKNNIYIEPGPSL